MKTAIGALALAAVTVSCVLSTPGRAESQAGAWEKFSIQPPVWAVGDFWAFDAYSPRESQSWMWTVDRVQRVDGTDFYVLKDDVGGWESFWRVNDLAFYMDLHKRQMQSRYVPPLQGYSWPVVLGKTWRQTTRREGRDGRWTELQLSCRVHGIQRTTIRQDATWNTVEILCKNEQTGEPFVRRWYAPSIKMWVREHNYMPYGLRVRELLGVRQGLQDESQCSMWPFLCS